VLALVVVGPNVGGWYFYRIPVGQTKLEREIKFDFVDKPKKDVLFLARQVSCKVLLKRTYLPKLREEN